MPSVFPSFARGNVWLSPAARSLAAPTRVLQFLNDQEQRWRAADYQESWSLTYSDLLFTEVTAIRNFFVTMKGAYDSTWTFPFDGTNFTLMCFDQDEFTAEETSPMRWNVSLKIRQTQKSATYASGVTATFPSICQLPFMQKARFRTVRNDLASGPRYSRYQLGTPLNAWLIAYSVLTATEMASLMDLFVSVGGRYGTIQFTDPQTAAVYTHCRFDTDTFEARYVGALQYAVSLPIVEFAA